MIITDVNLIDKSVFEFDNTNGPSKFTTDKCIFNNITRTGIYGGSIINAYIANNHQMYIKECSFTSISCFKNGGAIYVDISSGGSFEVGNSGDGTGTSTLTSFSSCSAGSGKGGGI
jgi:hypothetical protein